MTQKEVIKEMLLDNEWTCVTKMMAAFIPDYRRRICDLKEDGLVLEARPCKQHDHSSKTLQEWRLIGEKPLNSVFDTRTRQNKELGVAGQNFNEFPLQSPLFAYQSIPNH